MVIKFEEVHLHLVEAVPEFRATLDEAVELVSVQFVEQVLFFLGIPR